ncbi:STAS domain-containing protein [Mycolicibacterium arabiense]|uniref:STAS domain-containing protein n=1 Tax=Mycolicibacterium arabiense TaxID=1286181 RepID=UPI001F46FA13|nr:STAS domain-containing protein [Mycolicibacterium arabiense]
MNSAQPRGIELTILDVDGARVLDVRGVVDLLSAPAFREHVEAALAEAPRALLIDLTDVDFFASVGLEVLVSAHRSAPPTTQVAVVADGPATSRPIRITGVDQIVALYPTLQQAVDGIGH